MNFLSDTITLPSEDMMNSIMNAHLGDDVYGNDATVNELEKLAAELTGKESSCFMPSGTMANLASILAHSPRGSKVLAGDESDIYIFEAGGASVCGGIMYEPIYTQPNGQLSIESLEQAFPFDEEDPQFALPSLICLENSHNRMGGKVLPLSYLEEVYKFSCDKEIPIHMDGARIFNAAEALGVNVKEITQYADSLQFCLSKGLSAPIGSIVAGTKNHIDKVRRIRKMLGGGMRQVGIMAAPAIVALKNNIDRLGEDHQKAKKLAFGLEKIPGIHIDPSEVETNIVLFKVDPSVMTWEQFLKLTEGQGITLSEMGYGRIRAVIHRHITSSDVDKAIEIIQDVMVQKSHIS